MSYIIAGLLILAAILSVLTWLWFTRPLTKEEVHIGLESAHPYIEEERR